MLSLFYLLFTTSCDRDSFDYEETEARGYKNIGQSHSGN